jgi:LacI family transcriptional regulator
METTMPQIEPRAEARSARPTMKDVAALAGLSIKTVSRVVNGVSTVDPELATRVQEAARKLGYRPNLTASNLRRRDGRTLTIGMLVEDAANPFSAALMRAAEDIARGRGVLLLFGSLDEDPARERELVGALLNRRVDGLLMVPAGRDQSYLAAEQQAGTQLVFVDREPGLLNADAVVSDHRHGAITAVEHLLAHGHQRIGYLGDQITIPTAAQRFAGYQRALEHARVPFDQALVRHNLRTSEAAEDALERLLALPEPPTALFTSQNLVTIAACRALRRLRKHPAVAMVGFDDFPLADILEPGISVIAQDADALGRIAAQILFSRLDGDTSPTQTVTVPTRLIPRGSGELTTRSVRA